MAIERFSYILFLSAMSKQLKSNDFDKINEPILYPKLKSLSVFILRYIPKSQIFKTLKLISFNSKFLVPFWCINLSWSLWKNKTKTCEKQLSLYYKRSRDRKSSMRNTKLRLKLCLNSMKDCSALLRMNLTTKKILAACSLSLKDLKESLIW